MRSKMLSALAGGSRLNVLVIFLTLTMAADWPQFLGPNRDGASAETGLLQTWSKDGPPVLWRKSVGEGFSGPVVAGERLILFHRVGDQEVVECLDAATGKAVWKHAYATGYEDQLGKGNGPRSTPVIAGRNVITLGAEGRLQCLDLERGTRIWTRNVNEDYGVRQGYFGVGASPLVEGKLVLVNVGGRAAGIVAFELDSGKEVWKATNDAASYASPIAATVDGKRLAVFFTREGVDVLDPANGDVTFRKRWRSRNDASVNAASPLLIGDRVFISASYETGALLLKLRKDGADVVWQNDDVMSNHYNTCVYHKGHLYGFDGRQEARPNFRCVELAGPKVSWNRPEFGCGTMILAEDNLFVLTEAGELVLVEATPEAYREKARARVFDNAPCRAQIALANGRLYGRDQKELACWNLKR
jgi:outer membrane protein assembly factor BamB